jgi:hypothetical protein
MLMPSIASWCELMLRSYLPILLQWHNERMSPLVALVRRQPFVRSKPAAASDAEGKKGTTCSTNLQGGAAHLAPGLITLNTCL